MLVFRKPAIFWSYLGCPQYGLPPSITTAVSLGNSETIMTSLQLPDVRSTSIPCFKGIKQNDSPYTLRCNWGGGCIARPYWSTIVYVYDECHFRKNASYLSTP